MIIQSTDPHTYERLFQLINEVILRELLAAHYRNTVVTLLEWCFLREEKLTEEQAYKYTAE